MNVRASLKETLSSLGPGFKNPTLDDVLRLREDVRSLPASCGNLHPTAFGSVKIAFSADEGNSRAFASGTIMGHPLLERFAVRVLPNVRGNSKIQLISTSDESFPAIVTIVDLDGRSSKITVIKPEAETEGFEVVSRHKTSLVVTRLPFSTVELMDRLDRAVSLLSPTDTHKRHRPSRTSEALEDEISRRPTMRRRRNKPYAPRHLRVGSSEERRHRPSMIPGKYVLVAAVFVTALILSVWARTEPVPSSHRRPASANKSREQPAMQSMATCRRQQQAESVLDRVLSLRTDVYDDNVHYTSSWPPNASDIEAVAVKTWDLVMYAKAMKVLGIDFDERRNPRAVHWLPEDRRLHYFKLYDLISQHVSWILETTELPDVYKDLFGKAYRAMNLMCHVKASSTPLCYVGRDPTRDSFEFYLRLVSHFEYAAHIIDIKQWGLEIGVDPFPVLIEQAETLRNWLQKRWTTEKFGMCAHDWQVSSCNDLLYELPKQDELFYPYDHAKGIMLDTHSGRVYVIA